MKKKIVEKDEKKGKEAPKPTPNLDKWLKKRGGTMDGIDAAEADLDAEEAAAKKIKQKGKC